MIDDQAAAAGAGLPVPADDKVHEMSGVQRRRAKRHRALRAVPDAGAPAEVEQESPDNIVHIVRQLQEEQHAEARWKVGWPLISAIVCILIPTVLAAIYYMFIAADLYVSEARFSVRSNDTQAADALGVLTGMPRATVVSDSYIVADYVLSREMVEELEERLPFRQIYSDPRADFLTQLDPDISDEGLVSYWQDFVTVYFDSTKSTITVEVRAFDPLHAERVASELVSAVRELVNEISAQSRRDAVQFAAAEVARGELRVRGARDDMLAFRTENNEFDPAQTASATLGRVAAMETERSQLNSQLAAISGYLSKDAPSVQMLQARINALDEEIGKVEAEISTGGGVRAGSSGEAGVPSEALAKVYADYQELALNQTFAENAYTAALASLERARTEADRSQSYVAVYLNPVVPESATYPNRIMNTFIVLIVCCVVWGVGSLGYLTIRDHLV